MGEMGCYMRLKASDYDQGKASPTNVVGVVSFLLPSLRVCCNYNFEKIVF